MFLQAFAVKGDHPDHAKSRRIGAIHCVARQSNFHTLIPAANGQQVCSLISHLSSTACRPFPVPAWHAGCIKESRGSTFSGRAVSH